MTSRRGRGLEILFLMVILMASVSYSAGQQKPRYDLLLKGGHVIDPANNIDRLMDVAVADGKIAAVEPDIPSAEAGKVVDVHGLYVTPGTDRHPCPYWLWRSARQLVFAERSLAYAAVRNAARSDVQFRSDHGGGRGEFGCSDLSA